MIHSCHSKGYIGLFDRKLDFLQKLRSSCLTFYGFLHISLFFCSTWLDMPKDNYSSEICNKLFYGFG